MKRRKKVRNDGAVQLRIPTALREVLEAQTLDGKKTLAEVCREKLVNPPAVVWRALVARGYFSTTSPNPEFTTPDAGGSLTCHHLVPFRVDPGEPIPDYAPKPLKPTIIHREEGWDYLAACCDICSSPLWTVQEQGAKS